MKWKLGLYRDPGIQIMPIMENQMEKKMENEIETEVVKGLYKNPYTNNTYIGP